jgi:acylphosphatase
VRRIAEARAIAGSATNLPDGSVEVVLEGPRDDVEELIAYCSQGPERAEVSAVEVNEETPTGLDGFRTG